MGAFTYPNLNIGPSLPASGDGLRTANYWLERAGEVRTMAQSMRDPTAKALMRDIVHKYELLAKRAASREGARS